MKNTDIKLEKHTVYTSYLSIRAIEKEVGCPTDTLQKAVNGRQKLPQKWEDPLKQFLNNLKIIS